MKHVSSCSTLLHSWSIFGQSPIQRVPGFFPQRQSGRSVEHVRPCSTGVGSEWSCNSTLLYASNACARAILPFILVTTVHKPQFLKFISCYVSPVLGVWFPRCVARLRGTNSMFIHYIQNRRFQKGHALAQAVRRRRPKGLWDRLLPEYLDFPLFLSLPHQRSILIFWSYHKDKTTKPGNLPTKQRFLFFRYRWDINVLSHCFLHSQKTRCRWLWPQTLWNVLCRLAANFLAELHKHSAACSRTARLAAVDSAWPQDRFTSERARSAVPLSKTLFCEYSQLQSLWTFWNGRNRISGAFAVFYPLPTCLYTRRQQIASNVVATVSYYAITNLIEVKHFPLMSRSGKV